MHPRMRLVAFLLLWQGMAWGEAHVDINRADAQTLDETLVGVGPVKAEAIVNHREINGPYQQPEDLIEVKGIGPKTVERNRDRITIGAPAGEAPHPP